eukprot:g81278.t1
MTTKVLVLSWETVNSEAVELSRFSVFLCGFWTVVSLWGILQFVLTIITLFRLLVWFLDSSELVGHSAVWSQDRLQESLANHSSSPLQNKMLGIFGRLLTGMASTMPAASSFAGDSGRPPGDPPDPGRPFRHSGDSKHSSARDARDIDLKLRAHASASHLGPSSSAHSTSSRHDHDHHHHHHKEDEEGDEEDAPEHDHEYGDDVEDDPGLTAARNGDLEELRAIVHSLGTAAITKTDASGWTALHHAADTNQLRCVQLLLEHKADASVRASHNVTAFMRACRGGGVELARMLLEAKANIEDRDSAGMTALLLAAEGGNVEVLKWLTDTIGQSTQERDDDGFTALFWAAHEGHVDVTRFLVGLPGANVNDRAPDGMTPLAYAAWQGHLEVLKLLVEAKASANQADNLGVTPLHWAAEDGHRDCMAYLLKEAKADLTLQNQRGETPLLVAAEHGHLPLVKLLVTEYKASVAVRNSEHASPLICAAKNGHLPVVTWLITKAKMKINERQKDAHAYTSLLWAVQNKHAALVDWLIEANANISLVDRAHGMSALHIAASRGHVSIVERLLELKADLHARASKPEGSTALHLAAQEGHLEAVACLLRNPQASVDVLDTMHLTPLGAAVFANRLAVAKYLIKAKADLEARHADTLAPMQLAASQGHLPMLQMLIDAVGGFEAAGLTAAAAEASQKECQTLFQQQDKRSLAIGCTCRQCVRRGLAPSRALRSSGFNASGTAGSVSGGASPLGGPGHGRTALHLACSKGHMEAVKWLVSNAPACVHIQDPFWATPLHCAARSGYLEVVQFLVRAGADPLVPHLASCKRWSAGGNLLTNGEQAEPGKAAPVEKNGDCGCSIDRPGTAFDWALQGT